MTQPNRPPGNPARFSSYTQLATLLADHYKNREEALSVLNKLLERQPDNDVACTLRARIASGKRAATARRAPIGRAAASAENASNVQFPAARLRRALFLVETADPAGHAAALAEVRRALDQAPSLAYARYVAERVGLSDTGNAFALAFEHAARSGKPDAFQALAAQARGIDAHIARAGLALVTGESSIPIVASADEADTGAFIRRFSVLVDGMNRVLARPDVDRRPLLRLVSDFAASELSLAA